MGWMLGAWLREDLSYPLLALPGSPHPCAGPSARSGLCPPAWDEAVEAGPRVQAAKRGGWEGFQTKYLVFWVCTSFLTESPGPLCLTLYSPQPTFWVLRMGTNQATAASSSRTPAERCPSMRAWCQAPESLPPAGRRHQACASPGQGLAFRSAPPAETDMQAEHAP